MKQKQKLSIAFSTLLLCSAAYATNNTSDPGATIVTANPTVVTGPVTANPSANSNSSARSNSRASSRAQSNSYSEGGTGIGVGIGGQGGKSAANAAGGAAQSVGVGSQGQSVSIDSHAVVAAPYVPVSTAYSAHLTSSNDTCMGSSSGGVQGPGLGISVASTWTDKNCIMLKNARELWNMGMPEAALARMCMDDLNREAIELSGGVCPARKPN